MLRVATLDTHPRPFPVMLPLWRSAIFVDWHGVLCKEVFWFSIINNPAHPYHRRLRAATDRLFRDSPRLVEAWMRGSVTSEEIIGALAVRLDRRCKSDYLVRRLKDDCRQMRAHPRLLQELQTIRHNSFVVLATDNMDCFAERLRAGRDLAGVIDIVLCSTRLGVLKTDGVDKFFGPWLKAHALAFTDALLLDDNEDICAEFVSSGGTAVVVRSIEDALIEIRRWSVSRCIVAGA